MKRLLIIFFLMSSVVSASDFNITWTPVKEDIVNKEYIITIQNLDADMRTVDVESFFEDTNFDTSKIRDVEFYEQTAKPVTKEIKHYKTIKSLKTVTQIDNETKMLINVTKIVNESVLDYIEKKTVNEMVLDKQETKILKSDIKTKEVSHGTITLPSIKTVGKINNAGTKTFVLRFKTPPDGSYGKVGLKINGKEYHPYWNSTWSNRKKITLTGTSSGSQTDYQLLLNVTYEPEMNSDFSDVRFCNDTDQLSAWLESKVNESYALIWVKFPHTPADGETEDYWMYYGNAGAASDWDIVTTFLFGDDFSGDLSRWNILRPDASTYSVVNGELVVTPNTGTNVLTTTHFSHTAPTCDYETHVKIRGSPTIDYHGAGQILYKDDSNYFYIIHQHSSCEKVYSRRYTAGSWTPFFNTAVTMPTIYFKQRKVGGNYRIEYSDDNILYTTADTSFSWIPISCVIYAIGSSSPMTFYFDDYYVRKYVVNPPTATFGAEEHYVDSIYFNSSDPYYNLIDYKGDIALNHTYSSSDDLEWTAQAVDDDTGLVVTSMGSSEIDFTTYEGILDWLQLVNLDNSKIYTLQNSSGDLEEHQASGNAVNFTTDLSPDDYEIEITAVPTPSPTVTPTGAQPTNYSSTKMSDSAIRSLYYPFMYILFIVIIIGGFIHVFGN